MTCGTMPKRKERTFWRMEMQAAKKAMYLYPAGSDEREIYRAKYTEAVRQYNSLFVDLYRKEKTC